MPRVFEFPAILSTSTLLLALGAAGCIVLPGSDTDSESGTDGDSTTSASGSEDTGSGDETDSSDDGPPPPTERAVDILFVVDNSGSMGEEQAKLALGIDALVTALDAADPPVDYRIAVTTTDNGNPWCAGGSPESGSFQATSCQGRLTDFVFQGASVIDLTEEACLAICDHEDLGLTVPWLDVAHSAGTTNAPAGDVLGALRCMLPQGINGCGFEQPLESLSLALQRADTPSDDNNGFRRPGALLAVAIVTDEVDCSSNPAHDSIYLPEGNRVFWSDTQAPAPTSAVCWNAGVQCTGSGVYDECHAVDLGEDGNPVVGDPAQDAVLRPLAGYIDDLTSRGAYVIAINGVGSDGQPVYADAAGDPIFQGDFGIGPGCSSAVGEAVPPVRIRELVDTVTGPGNLH
ncbi:MAG: hypothetical protein KDK70_12450, partial [Myxococcales bacterium]|nr:hypothetical protein [Myxococcales bacterium]